MDLENSIQHFRHPLSFPLAVFVAGISLSLSLSPFHEVFPSVPYAQDLRLPPSSCQSQKKAIDPGYVFHLSSYF